MTDKEKIMLLVIFALLTLITTWFAIGTSYEWKIVQTDEIKLIPVSCIDYDHPLFYGKEKKGKDVFYFVQIDNGGEMERVNLPAYRTSITKNSVAVLKKHTITPIPKKQFFDFLFIQHSSVVWEICIP